MAMNTGSVNKQIYSCFMQLILKITGGHARHGGTSMCHTSIRKTHRALYCLKQICFSLTGYTFFQDEHSYNVSALDY